MGSGVAQILVDLGEDIIAFSRDEPNFAMPSGQAGIGRATPVIHRARLPLSSRSADPEGTGDP